MKCAIYGGEAAWVSTESEESGGVIAGEEYRHRNLRGVTLRLAEQYPGQAWEDRPKAWVCPDCTIVIAVNVDRNEGPLGQSPDPARRGALNPGGGWRLSRTWSAHGRQRPPGSVIAPFLSAAGAPANCCRIAAAGRAVRGPTRGTGHVLGGASWT